jgi:hypothetical protein
MKRPKWVPDSGRIDVAELAACALSVVREEQSFALTPNTIRKK